MVLIDSLVQWKHLPEELALVLAIMEKTRSTELCWIHCWHLRWLEVLNFSLIFDLFQHNVCLVIMHVLLNAIRHVCTKQHLIVDSYTYNGIPMALEDQYGCIG